jgi:hypothetical protein
METTQRIDEQTRKSSREAKSPIKNRKEEVGSVQEEGIDHGERRRKGKPSIGNRKEAAKMSDSEALKEVERLMACYAIATKKVLLGSEEERRSRYAREKNQPKIKRRKSRFENNDSDPMALKAEMFRDFFFFFFRKKKPRCFAMTGRTCGQAYSVLTRTSVSPSSNRHHDDSYSLYTELRDNYVL